jgi:light-regulated signal transduction histidine kinase (bacteriophytochrome)
MRHLHRLELSSVSRWIHLLAQQGSAAGLPALAVHKKNNLIWFRYDLMTCYLFLLP